MTIWYKLRIEPRPGATSHWPTRPPATSLVVIQRHYREDEFDFLFTSLNFLFNQITKSHRSSSCTLRNKVDSFSMHGKLLSNQKAERSVCSAAWLVQIRGTPPLCGKCGLVEVGGVLQFWADYDEERGFREYDWTKNGRAIRRNQLHFLERVIEKGSIQFSW